MDAKSSVFQSHLILVGCARLQVEVAGCRFVCSQCWFAVPDRRNQSRSKNAMIAGRCHFDCRSLHLCRFLCLEIHTWLVLVLIGAVIALRAISGLATRSVHLGAARVRSRR
ncbi:hypothetical protein ALQ13_200039 [Pseudomonas savastanoi pv. glycinea]|nr:hypothetical protein ALQ13_200039 [Pseudomonas savastanoi pv. glycinea]